MREQMREQISSQSQRQARLARLNDTLAAWLAAHAPPSERAHASTHAAHHHAPTGYHALPAPHDGLADDPRLARTAFVRAFITRALLSAQQQAMGQPRPLLRGLARARGLLLYRVARARHAGGQPLPLNPLWRDRKTGQPRHVPAWALAGLPDHPLVAAHQHTTPRPRPGTASRAATDSPGTPSSDPYSDPNNDLIAHPNDVIDLGDGVMLSGDEVQALWDAFVADPPGVLGAADTGDWLSLDEAARFFAEFEANPIGMIARYGGAEGLLRYISGHLAADPPALWDHLLTSVGPSLALGGAEGDALAFWATNGEVFTLTPDEIARASATGPTPPEQDAIALSDQDIAYPYPDHLLAEGAVLSDLTVVQVLNAYWAQQDAQTAGQIALGDAGVPAGLVSSFDLVNPAMTDFLRQQAGALVTGIDARTRALLGDALWNAYAGIDFAALPRDARMADYLRNYLNLFNNDLQGMSRQRALLIARTEGARAANFGSMVAFARLGVRYVRWVTNAGACLICVGNGEMDYVKYGSDFPSRDKSPPAHPLCRCALGPYVPDTFDPNDWTSLPLSPDDVAAMLFNPDYGAFPASDWPSTAGDAAAPAKASASDLGLLDTASMAPALQRVLTPDAIASLQAALGGAADSAAQQWLDEQGLPMPQSESGFTYYFDPEQADAEPQMNPDTIARIRAQFGQAVDDWLASMQDGQDAAADAGDVGE